jgi:hypothetical protein
VPRLIEVQPHADGPALVDARVGDVIQFGATGGRVTEGLDVVEPLGAFVQGVSVSGQTVMPEGAPSTVLFRARQPGAASVQVMTGDPWGEVRSHTFEIRVEP